MKTNTNWKKEFIERLRRFAVMVILLANKLPKSPAGFVIAHQFIKAGTSIGANAGEAQDASSLKDFIHKLSIALREAKETLYWLEIINEANLLDKAEAVNVLNECKEIVAILTSSIKSSKNKI